MKDILWRVRRFPAIAMAAAGALCIPAPSNADPPNVGAKLKLENSGQPDIDESALRYFASKGDKVRLESEIARLRALYPNWKPPADPLAAPLTTDPKLDAMWQLYAQSKLAELRKAIADRRTAEPGWVPPDDLVERLEIAENRAALIVASNSGSYEDVVNLGARTPSLLTCGDVDVLWRVAEAFAKTRRPERALDAYSYILGNCEQPSERLATIQKAMALLDYAQMQQLLAREKPLPDGSLEFEPLRDDLARHFISEASKENGPVIASAYLDRLKRSVDANGTPSDAELLGWYLIRHDDMSNAETYFRKAHEKQDSATVSQGLALSLIARKEPREAEEIMYRWRDSSEQARATYFAATANLLSLDPLPPLPAAVLNRMAAFVTQHREIKTAEQFGWYALAFRQPRTAALWFRAVLGWQADYEPAAYGLALSHLQLGNQGSVRQIQRLWASRSERIAHLGERKKRSDRIDEIANLPAAPKDDLSKRAENGRQDIDVVDEQALRVAKRSGLKIRSPRADNVEAVAGECRTWSQLQPSRPESSLQAGWCLMRLNRPLEAVKSFDVALGSASEKARRDAAYGQSLAYLRAGLVDEAALAATKAKQDFGRSVELQRAILSARAISAFDAGGYNQTVLYLDQLAQIETQRSDLLVLRAYAYLKLNRRTQAKQIFEALAATGNRDAIRGLGEMNQAATSPR